MNMTHWAAETYDPVFADYAARTIALGTTLGDTAVVLRARAYAALASVWAARPGWDDCEAAWREAMATDGSIEEVGLIGSAICWTAAYTTTWTAPSVISPKHRRSATTVTSERFS